MYFLCCLRRITAPAVVLAGAAGVAINGGDVGPIPALTDANMTGGALAGEVEERDVSRPVISHRLLLVEGHQRGTVGVSPPP